MSYFTALELSYCYDRYPIIMAIEQVSDLNHLIPNKLTLVFSVACAVLVAVGNALLRRYKVKQKQNYVILFNFNFFFVVTCSIANDAIKYPDRLLSSRFSGALPNFFFHRKVFNV